MKNGLWGHALLLASKMDSRTHARVMTRFANSLPINDPLQTVYQLMSGRMPAASTCCGDEKWGDWRPHLAMVLSNLNNNMDVESRTMVTMGDTLASKGLLDAAHFCYLMAQVGFGVYTKKTTKLVLIGSNHRFATNEAIQRTEAYEYAQSLGAQTSSLPSFQVFKFIYSCRLAEMGLATQAFHYCEVIARSILLQPHRHSPVLLRQLVQVASQLRLFDPQLREKPEEEFFVEPAWLAELRRVEKQVQEGTVVWSQDGTFPLRCPSTPSSEAGQCDGLALTQLAGLGTDNPLLVPPGPSAEHLSQDVWLLPSAPSMLPDSQSAIPARVPMFPVPQPMGPVEPGPGYGPPGPALGFPESPGPDPAALYPGPGLTPGAPPLQESDHLLPDPRSQVPGGSRARYVDVLNPGGPQRSEPALAPSDFFAPLAPLPIPAHLFGPHPDAEDAPPAEGAGREGQAPAGGPANRESASEPKGALPGEQCPSTTLPSLRRFQSGTSDLQGFQPCSSQPWWCRTTPGLKGSRCRSSPPCLTQRRLTSHP
ncbi:hypothetical protein CB1_000156005 [Camelus ferus]|nr:hypothetical protein CB1_000725003 [Camelus ferus]EQB77112.1 hypothetical protein CB1_000156005 [Camelus ferus]